MAGRLTRQQRLEVNRRVLATTVLDVQRVLGLTSLEWLSLTGESRAELWTRAVRDIRRKVEAEVARAR